MIKPRFCGKRDFLYLFRVRSEDHDDNYWAVLDRFRHVHGVIMNDELPPEQTLIREGWGHRRYFEDIHLQGTEIRRRCRWILLREYGFL